MSEADLQAKLDELSLTARKAYLRFQIALKALRGTGKPAEQVKAHAAYGDALEALTGSLSRITEVVGLLHPTAEKAPARAPAPRYSSDMRR